MGPFGAFKPNFLTNVGVISFADLFSATRNLQESPCSVLKSMSKSVFNSRSRHLNFSTIHSSCTCLFFSQKLDCDENLFVVARRHRRHCDGEQRSRQGNSFENDATRSGKQALASLSSGCASGDGTSHSVRPIIRGLSRSIEHRRRFAIPRALLLARWI